MSATGFVRRHSRLTGLGFVPEICLHLAVDDAIDVWESAQEAPGRVGDAPPFWAFAWPGGLALARHLLDHPELVAGRPVVDLATGSGIAAIAAALAGAAVVTAHDIDLFAVVAARLNAAANGVRVSASVAEAGDVPLPDGAVVLAGDVFYDRDIAAAFERALTAARATGAVVIVGDPYRSYLPTGRLAPLARYEVPVDRDLEDSTVKPTVVARFR